MFEGEEVVANVPRVEVVVSAERGVGSIELVSNLARRSIENLPWTSTDASRDRHTQPQRAGMWCSYRLQEVSLDRSQNMLSSTPRREDWVEPISY